jgi:O-antigen/teichoic acid export membrane protein
VLRKSLIKVGFVGSGNIINALLGFTFLAAVAKTLDLDSFGKYALLTTLLVSISKLIDFGTNSVFVAKSISKEGVNLNNAFLTTKVLLTLATFPIYIIALILLHDLSFSFLVILFLGSIVYGINYTLFGFFQKDEKYTLLVLLNLLPSIIKGAFALLIFTSVYKPGLIQATAIFSLSIIASSLLIPFSKNIFKFKFTLHGVSDLIKISYPAGVSQLIAESWPTISNAAAKLSGGFADVGIFSLASKISHIFALASLSIFTVLLPKNANRKKQNLQYDFTETFIISAIILFLSALAIPLSHFFVNNFFGSKFQGSIVILNILVFSAAITSIHSFIENYFFVEQKTNYIMYINITKLGIFIALCSFLIPLYSLSGLAYSDLIASLCAALFTVILIRKSKSLSKSL